MSARTLPSGDPQHAPAPGSAANAANETLHIAVLPGDGIGPEVMAEAVRVLRAVEPALAGIRLTLEELPAGAEEFRRRGDPLPAETLAACRAADAVLIGPMGLPEIRWPDGRESRPSWISASSSTCIAACGRCGCFTRLIRRSNLQPAARSTS
jgi:hypothetical protein